MIYVDTLFLLNFTVDYFLLFLTAKSAGLYPRRLRLLAGALMGAVFSVLLYFPPLNGIWSILCRIGSGCAVVLVAFGTMSGARLARLCGSFLLMTLLLAGVVFLLSQMAGGLSVQNGVFYADLSAAVMLPAFLLSYFLAGLVLGRGRAAVSRAFHEVEATLGKNTIRFRALEDSGNLLRDPISGCRVIVTDPAVLSLLLGAEALPLLQEKPLPRLDQLREVCGTPFWFLPAETAAGRGMLPVFRAEELYIDGRRPREYLLGLSLQPVDAGGDCRALMGA